ncbi:MAG: glycoside hydrolase family 5 protein [Verrucomicrobiota bacterium]
MQVRTLLPAFAGVILSFAATAADTNGLFSSSPRPFDPALAAMRLQVSGTNLLNPQGNPVGLYGVNIASLEWRNDGDHIEESFRRAIQDWKVNFIRLPLAQDRWFGQTTNQSDGGAAYRELVDKLVDLCAARRVYIDLDLHWSNRGRWSKDGGHLGQHVMPDVYSVEFWKDVATRYRDFPNVIFGLYNEPYDISFEVWRDGGTVHEKPPRRSADTNVVTFESAGMQKLYDAVRAAGAGNVVTASGTDWGYDLSGILEGHELKGSNIVYETHPYPFKKNWDRNFGAAAARYPVFIGEWGSSGSNGIAYGSKLMEYADRHGIRIWTAWDLHTSAGPTLIQNWQYEPTTFGAYVKEVLEEKAAAAK